MKRLAELALIPTAALACGLVSNALAGPERRLAWSGRPLEAPAPMAPAPTPVLPPTPSPAPAQPSAPSASPRPTAPIPGTAPLPAARPAPSQVPTPAPAPTSTSPFQEIGSDEAWRAHQAGARFLDARRSADFRSGHIAGAWSVPVWESDLEARLTAFEAGSGASFGDLLVLYCGGGDCQDSHLLAGRLLALGYRTLRIYHEGYPDWVAKGRPVRAGGER